MKITETSKMKKIIAREGLIILGILLASYLFMFVIHGLFAQGLILFFFGYPAYLTFRFILWAAKTLWGEDAIQRLYFPFEKGPLLLLFIVAVASFGYALISEFPGQPYHETMGWGIPSILFLWSAIYSALVIAYIFLGLAIKKSLGVEKSKSRSSFDYKPHFGSLFIAMLILCGAYMFGFLRNKEWQKEIIKQSSYDFIVDEAIGDPDFKKASPINQIRVIDDIAMARWSEIYKARTLIQKIVTMGKFHLPPSKYEYVRSEFALEENPYATAGYDKAYPNNPENLKVAGVISDDLVNSIRGTYPQYKGMTEEKFAAAIERKYPQYSVIESKLATKMQQLRSKNVSQETARQPVISN